MTRFTARPLDESEETAWAALWGRSRRLLVHHPAWIRATAPGPVVFLGVFSGGELVAGMPFHVRRRRAVRCWVSPTPGTFAGLVYTNDAGGESFLRDALAAVAAAVPAGVGYADSVLGPGAVDARGLAWAGWRLRPHYNYLSEISREGDLLRQAENNVRRQARKAESSGMRLVTGREAVEGLAALWEETRARQGLEEHSAVAAVRALAAADLRGASPELGAEPFALVDDAAVPHAAALLAWDATRVSYMVGAARHAGSETGSGAPSLLQALVTDAVLARRGPFLYDWVGANTPSVAAFKKKFRPQLEVLVRGFRTRGLARLWRL